jgi:ribosomal protein S18 acetylase RimI-like enzyme
MKTIKINLGDIENIRAIKILSTAIYKDIYSDYMPFEHINFYIEEYQSVGAIEKQLAKGSEYYLFEMDEEFVAYLGIEYEEQILKLSKLYVLPKYRKAGIGKEAMEIVFRTAKEKQLKTIQLIVNRNNSNAISYYKKWGFKIIEQVVHTYPDGHSEEDYLMELIR